MPLADNETRLVVSASRTELMKMKDDGVAVLTRLADVLDMKPKDVQDKVRLCDAKTPQPCWNGSPSARPLSGFLDIHPPSGNPDTHGS